jgi:ferredoxin-NADP reductase
VKTVKIIPDIAMEYDGREVIQLICRAKPEDKVDRTNRLMANRCDRSKEVFCITTGQFFGSITEAAEALKLDKAAISRVVQGKQHSTHGYQFVLKKDIKVQI